MAQHLYFARDTKLFIEFDSVVWEIPVLDGFSFSQSTNATEITLAEMENSAGVSRRGRRAFNDSLAPAEWSFSTYVRPFISAGSGAGAADGAAEHHAVEEVLWALMAGATDYDGTTYDFDRGGNNVITPSGSSSLINFTESNKSTLGTANLYFVLGSSNRQTYKISSAVVNEASIDFDIDGIATINWSGFGSEVVDMWGSTKEGTDEPNNGDTTNDGSTIAVGDIWLDTDNSYRLAVMTNVTAASEASTPLVYEKVTATDNFIRNRLTVATITANATDPDNDGTAELLSTTYDLTLTGGNITIGNNLTYIIPEELGTVNTPFAHVTGTRSVSGNFTCYLQRFDGTDGQGMNSGDTSTPADDSANFFEDFAAIDNVITNSFAVAFKIGGASGTPRLELNCPTTHVEIPAHSIEDVITVETNFQALPSTISGTDELDLAYVGA